MKIKQIPDAAAEAVGLAKYGRSKIPGTKHIVMAGQGPDGRWVTGIDENSLSVRNITDADKKKKEIARLKKLREELENATGHNLSSDAKNEFWTEFLIDLTAMSHVNMNNPLDKLAVLVAVANGDLAPDTASANTAKYLNAKFYIFDEDVESDNKMTKIEMRDKAKYLLVPLKAKTDHLRMLARYLMPGKIQSDLSTNTLYILLSEFIETETRDKKVTNAEKFVDAAELPKEELYVKVIVDSAIEKKLITYQKGLYQRGNITYGKEPSEVLEFFQDPENAGELHSIKKELETDFAFSL